MRHAARLVRVLGPDGALTAVALLLLGGLALRAGGRLDLTPDAALPLVVLGILLGLTALIRAPLLLGDAADRARFVAEQVRAARTFAPLLLVLVAYRLLVGAASQMTRAGLEDQLRALDELVLGTSPSFSLQHVATPWLTDLMAYGYASMFPVLLALMLLLYARGRGQDFRTVGLSILAAFYLGLVLYVLFPARSPRLVYAYDVPLRGALGLYELTTAYWDRVQAVQYDAFPSLHTAISTICLVWAWRHGDALSARWPRLLFWIFLPHVLALQAATLYLRQHYFVDLLAGWALAAAVVWLAPRLQRSFQASHQRWKAMSVQSGLR